MKKITLLVVIFSFCFNCYAQSYYEVCSWQVETRIGGLLFGISETKDGADAVMYDFQRRNKGLKYDISDHVVAYHFTIYPINKVDENPVTKFQNYAKKAYKVLSSEDTKSTEVDKKTRIDSSYDYYVSVRDDKRGFVKDLIAGNTLSPTKNKLLSIIENKQPAVNNTKEQSLAVEDKKSTKKNHNVQPASTKQEIKQSIAKNQLSQSQKLPIETKLIQKNERLLTTDINPDTQVILWEVPTRIDGLLFGVSATKDEADAIMYDFQKRNEGSKYDISDYPAKYKSTNKLDRNSVDHFVNLTGKPYKVISIDDIKSLNLIRTKGFDIAVDYYMNTRDTGREFTTKRLSYIYNGYEKYRIFSENFKSIATSK